MKMKMTMAVALVAAMCGLVCEARPSGGAPRPSGGAPRPGAVASRPVAPRPAAPRPRVQHRPAPAPAHHHHSSGSFWGHGGKNFWPGFVGGVIGGVLVDAVTPSPVVVAPAPVVVTPTVTTQNVWVEGRYIDQVQPNGTIIRVWQPGHYETRQVVY